MHHICWEAKPNVPAGCSACSCRRGGLLKPPWGWLCFQGFKLGCPLAGAAVPGGWSYGQRNLFYQHPCCASVPLLQNDEEALKERDKSQPCLLWDVVISLLMLTDIWFHSFALYPHWHPEGLCRAGTAYYNILLNLGLLDLSRFVGLILAKQRAEVRIGWLRKIYLWASGLEVWSECCCSRGGCSSQSPARLPAPGTHAAVCCPVTSAASTTCWVRQDQGGKAAATPSPSTVLHVLPCDAPTEDPFLSPHGLLSSITHFVITKLPACQAEGPAENLLMPKPWELMSLLSLAVVTPTARARMKPKEQKVLCEIPE